MDRREKGDALYREKFIAFGLCEKFEYIRREWSLPHDKRFWSRCKACGAEFLSWNEVFKGRQSRLICPECGAASDGSSMFTRTEKAKDAAALYASGMEQEEIALHVGCSVSDVGNAARFYGVRDASRKARGVSKSNHKRMAKKETTLSEELAGRGLELVGHWCGKRNKATIRNIRTGELLTRSGAGLCDHPSIKRRAERFASSKVDSGITISKLAAMYGEKCYICGKQTDFGDKRWGNYGPDYPTIDHVVPISRGGAHSWENVKLCCAECNVRKGNRPLLEVLI